MKTTPLVLLLALVLLTSHARPGACRPRSAPGLFDGSGRFQSQLDEVLLRAVGDNAVSYLLADKLLRYLKGNPNALRLYPRDGEVTAAQLDARALAHLAHLARSEASAEMEEEAERRGKSPDDFVELSKRNDDPPISIDLTFHLLRNMIEMAKIESQKEQAELNRKFLDEVGK
ncbi:urotensin 1 [Lampris incognitus]|uniref:urotensin 1 n=1 Tax=Lampris incognitus TaxID=2546036 RepID=UPI0024B4CB97|nr:urotensin 1 [Lampris incognitus]